MKNDILLLLQSKIASSLPNIDSTRVRNPSLEKRCEGWTEVWGGASSVTSNGKEAIGGGTTTKAKKTDDDDWNFELDSQGRNEQRTTLVQYRVAWLEQLILRIYRIPHVVVNSPYNSTESTGPLPYLTDFVTSTKRDYGGVSSGDDDTGMDSNKPVLIGRHHAGGVISNTNLRNDEDDQVNNDTIIGSDIVSYLLYRYGTTEKQQPRSSNSNDYPLLSSTELTLSQQSDVKAYGNFIQQLQFITLALRYGDEKAWHLIYRHQCLDACLNNNQHYHVGCDLSDVSESRKRTKGRGGRVVGGAGGFFHWLAWYQAWSERTTALKFMTLGDNHATTTTTAAAAWKRTLFSSSNNCNTYDGHVNVSKAVELAKNWYRALDAKLGESISRARRGINDDPSSTSSTIVATTPTKITTTTADTTPQTTTSMPVFLLGTTKPTMVDAVLFAHLADALCDIHLITVLADCTNLITFFHDMYERYFGKEYYGSVHNSNTSGGGGGGGDDDDGGVSSKVDWIRYNNFINGQNRFNHIPIGSEDDVVDDDSQDGKRMSWLQRRRREKFMGEYNDAIQIMQSVSVHCHDLRDVLMAAKVQREREEGFVTTTKKKRGAGWMVYRWRMGGSLWKDDDKDELRGRDGKTTRTKSESTDEHGNSKEQEDDLTRKTRAHMERMKRENKTNDELWISGVFVGCVMALVFAAASSASQ